jgi:hypothetical protein
MARFTVRVELHDATWDHYKKLYTLMAQQGLTDVITTTSGSVKMPPGEYNMEGSLTKEQVLEKAKTAAAQVVRSYAVLVTESSGRTWHGLSAA